MDRGQRVAHPIPPHYTTPLRTHTRARAYAGLWPNNNDGTYPQFCSGEKYNST